MKPEEQRLPGMPGPTMDEVRQQVKLTEALEAIAAVTEPMLTLVGAVTIEKLVGGVKLKVTVARVKQ